MPRILRIKNTIIHVPSLFNVNMGTSLFGYPYMHLSYHTKQEMTISYAKWDDCERDFNRVKSALKEIETSLQSIPLLDEPVSVSVSSRNLTLTPVAPVAPVENS
jgi:hypothetical protein